MVNREIYMNKLLAYKDTEFIKVITGIRRIYRRYDYKDGRKLPQGAIPCQEKADPITGHFPHWLLCTVDDPNSKHQLEAFERQKSEKLENGTYELIGKHINGNSYNLNTDVLVNTTNK